MTKRKKTRQKWLGAACLLEEQSSLPWERSLILVVIFVSIGFFRWASITPLDELVVATGELMPETSIVTVQSGIPGIVQDILVDEGSLVKVDEPLVALQFDETMEEIRRFGIQHKGLKNDLEFVNKEIKARKELADEGLFPSLNLLQLYAKRKEIQNRMEELDESSSYRFGMAKMSTIRAPISGQIQEIHIPHKLASIRAGENLMEIVPTEANLYADLKIKPSDIGHIQIGQTVVLRVTTFDVARYGVVSGSLTYLSPSTLVGKEGLPYFKAKVKLNKQYVTTLATGLKHALRTGMTVDAEVKVGTKTIMEYLLKPVLSITQSAMHEE